MGNEIERMIGIETMIRMSKESAVRRRLGESVVDPVVVAEVVEEDGVEGDADEVVDLHFRPLVLL